MKTNREIKRLRKLVEKAMRTGSREDLRRYMEARNEKRT